MRAAGSTYTAHSRRKSRCLGRHSAQPQSRLSLVSQLLIAGCRAEPGRSADQATCTCTGNSLEVRICSTDTMHVSWLGFGCDFRTDFARIPSFHTQAYTTVHERQPAQEEPPTRGPAACARRTAPRTRHASSSAARMRVLTRGNRSESVRLPSTTSIARSPPAAIPARRCGAATPAAKGRHRTSAGAAPHARYQRGRAPAHAMR